MPRRIHLHPHLTEDELHDRYRRADHPVERTHWHFLWLLASGLTATAVAGYQWERSRVEVLTATS